MSKPRTTIESEEPFGDCFDRGFDGNPPASPFAESNGTASGWYTVGYFSDSGSPSNPGWTADLAPPEFTPEAGVGIDNLDGRAAFIQLRLTFRLPPSLSPEDPGPFVERLDLRFSTDA